MRKQWWWQMGCGMVVVCEKDVMEQCLGMGDCQTLQLLIVNTLIIN